MNQGSAETTRSHVSFDRRARISAVLGGTRIPIGPVVKWIQGSLYQPTALIWGTAVVYGSYAGALLLRFRGDVPPESWQRFVYVVPLIAAGYLLGNLVFGVYRAEWRYSATRDVVGLAIGVTLVTGAVFGINYSSSDRDIPPSVNLISGALILLGTLTLEAATVRGYAGALLARATVFSSPVYRVALGLAALFLLSMAIWIAVRLAGYAPVQIDDSRVQADIFRVLRSNGTWLFEGGLPFLEAFTYASLVKLFGWGVPLVLVPLLFSAALALLLGYVAYRVTGDWWAALAAVLLLPSLPIFLTQARLLPFYPPTMFFGYAGVAAAAT
ncbi:MAG: hypothetical protein ACE5JL_03190, partial [Dehalococcoidia bacterium]